MAPLSPESCAMCGKEEARHCTRCKSIAYCSTACQKADWVTHKLLCRPFSEFDVLTRPSPQHYRAIFFPEEEQKPKLIWLYCVTVDDEDEGHSQYGQTAPYLGRGGAGIDVAYNCRLRRKLSRRSRLDHKDNFLADGSKINQSIWTTLKPDMTPYWCGPVVAYGTLKNNTKTRDLSLADFRNIVDHFHTYDRNKRCLISQLEAMVESDYNNSTTNQENSAGGSDCKDTGSNTTNSGEMV
ncbi:hypothetical protein IWZ01DRAFT_287130 [Phyllosticta capitalensis]|uniref:MYND-type domain-containing protein n=1 Tax=Phyllosticta capitalensis TaxID=121624 RepID=A0ABR1YPD6_9PEZI